MQYSVREYDENLKMREYIVNKITDVPHRQDCKYVVREVKSACDGHLEFGDIMDCYTYH